MTAFCQRDCASASRPAGPTAATIPRFDHAEVPCLGDPILRRPNAQIERRPEQLKGPVQSRRPRRPAMPEVGGDLPRIGEPEPPTVAEPVCGWPALCAFVDGTQGGRPGTTSP